MIDVKNLTFSYHKKKVPIYQNLSFKIQDNESLAILGFNGAGKSTLMKLLLGILHPNRGAVEINGMNIHKKRIQAMQHIGVVWGQKPSLWWDISIKRSYDTLAKIYRIPDAVYQEKLTYLNSELQVGEFWNQPLRNVSLGQRVKAEIMGALLHDPSLLILDEPFIGLDFITREKVIHMLKSYIAKSKCTMILTSHNIDDVTELCSRMLLIEHGNIIHEGYINELLDKYHHLSEIIITHEANKLTITLEHEGLFDIEKMDEHISKITIKSKQIDQVDVMKDILNHNMILDFKVKGISLEYVIKNLVS